MPQQSNRAKNQHYVPQFLLRNFAGAGEQLHVFDKSTEKSFRTTPRNIAAETGFYDFCDHLGEAHSLEQLLTLLEGQAAAIVKTILSKQSLAHLSKSDRRTMSLFAAVQQLRVKGVRHRLAFLNQDIRQELARRGIDPGEVVPEMSEEDVKRLALQEIGLAKANAKLFFEKSWVLQRAPAGQRFYISDSPITLHNVIPHEFGNVGLAVPGIEIYLPLSPEFCLQMLCPQWYQQVRAGLSLVAECEPTRGACPVDVEPLHELARAIETGAADLIAAENMTHQNSLQVIYASRFIICDSDKFELVRLMLKRSSRHREPHRLTVH